MTAERLRCIDSGALSPTLNMGLDEALLRTPGPATLRLYGWSPPGLSLGYFQASREFADVRGDHVLVRRLTGGGAIYHDRELTFALTADARHLPAALPDSYALIHRAVQRALEGIGVRTRALGPASVGQPRPREPWCLADRGPHDLQTDSGGKILGSAQRRIREPHPRLLHHGSIVLSAHSTTPRCGAVAEHNASPAAVQQLALAVAREVGSELGLAVEPGEPTAWEWARARELAASRYSDPGFTHRR